MSATATLTSTDPHADFSARGHHDTVPLDRALLLYLDDRPQREIADILGISESNVSTKIGRLKNSASATHSAQTWAWKRRWISTISNPPGQHWIASCNLDNALKQHALRERTLDKTRGSLRPLFLVQVLTGLADVDLLAKAPTLVWSGYGIGIIGLLATWWFHCWARRPVRAEFGRRMDDGLGGGSLRKPLAQLGEPQRFERD